MSALKPPFRFRLRKELVLEGTALRDPLTGTVYALNELARKIIETIDAQISADELLAKVVRQCAVDRAKVRARAPPNPLIGAI